MSQQPPHEYGSGGEQYGQGFGGQGTEGFGQQSGQPGQPSQQFGQGAEQFGQRGGRQQGVQGSQHRGIQGGQQQAVQSGQGMDIKLEEGLSEEMRVVLHDLVQSVTACEWCAERCIDEGPEMSECLRLCRDVADLATLNVQFIARDSIFGPEAIEVFASAAEACAQECARHGHRHCQECAEVLSRAVQSSRKMLASFGQGGGQLQSDQMQGGPLGSGQFGGGQMGHTGSSQRQEFGQPRGFPEGPGQQAQLPIESEGEYQGQQGRAFQQPPDQEYGRSQQSGQPYGGGQSYEGGSGVQGSPAGRQY